MLRVHLSMRRCNFIILDVGTVLYGSPLTLKPSLGISMQVIGVLRYFTPDYVQSVARLTMISFRNASQIYLSVSVEMWRILITTLCIVHSIADREQS